MRISSPAMPRTVITTAAVTALVAVVAGCGAADTTADTAPGSSSSASSPSASSSTPGSSGAEVPGATVPEILAFTSAKVGGGTFDAASLAGKDTVFWFWAPWCTICARSAPGVKAAAQALPDVTFVGVAGLSSDASAMGAFVSRNDVGSFTELADTKGDLYTRFGVAQQHTYVLVSKDGTVTRKPAYGKDIDVAELARSTFG